MRLRPKRDPMTSPAGIDFMRLRNQENEIRPFLWECGFSLLELLVSTTVVVVLAAILLPVAGKARRKAQQHMCRKQIEQLEIAIVSFRERYGYFPQAGSWADLSTALNGNIDPRTHTPAATGSWPLENNPLAIQFLKVSTEEVDGLGQIIDPWGMPYIVLADHGGSAVGKPGWVDPVAEDRKVPLPGGAWASCYKPVMIYSFGPDRLDNNDGGPIPGWDPSYTGFTEFDDVSNYYDAPW